MKSFLSAFIYTVIIGGVGVLVGSNNTDCRARVLRDINDFETYKAKLQTTVSPDFLTTLTKGR